MSINSRKKLLGEELPYEEMLSPPAGKTPSPVNQLINVDVLSERIKVQAQEIEYLRGELEKKTEEFQKLLSVVEDQHNANYREAFRQGKADGLKLYQSKLEELEENCNRGVDSLRNFVLEAAEKDRQFIEECIAQTVSIAVAKVIGEVRINPNYLSDKICQVLQEMNPKEKAEIQIGERLYGVLKENKLAFERVLQLGQIRCNPDMHPFDLLIETSDEIVDAGYCTQVRKLHELISKFMA